MEKKRKAAAEIFAANQSMQQQAAKFETDSTSVEDDDGGEDFNAMKRIKSADSGSGTVSPPEAQKAIPAGRPKTSEELQIEKEPIQVHEKGLAFWKRVIVPPNAYVVHTRLGRKDPQTIGLGVSFRYNPYTDAYLVVPSAMQTIGVVANCITREKQGINVLAYVQWQIDDFSIAYRRLDFSDSRDPLGIVNAQLGEQAEAAIKDKISTMSVEDVLTDKAPVIEELTTRLKAVAEGRNQHEQSTTGEGLGIKIITVQIREALVSSQRLWNDLQAPYRHQQQQTARISELTMQSEIRKQQLEAEQHKIQLEENTTVVKQDSQQRLQKREAQIEQERALSALQQEQEKTLERTKLESEARKHQKTLEIDAGIHALEEENRLDEQKVRAEQQQLKRETSLKQAQIEAKQQLQAQEDTFEAQVLTARLEREQQEHESFLRRKEDQIAILQKELENDRIRQEIRNLVNEQDLLRQLIERLPDLAAQMPEIHELKVLQTGKGNAAFDQFAAVVTKVLSLAESLGIHQQRPDEAATVSTPGEDTMQEP